MNPSPLQCNKEALSKSKPPPESCTSTLNLLSNQDCIYCRIRTASTVESGLHLLSNQDCIYCRIRTASTAESGLHLLPYLGDECQQKQSVTNVDEPALWGPALIDLRQVVVGFQMWGVTEASR
jgi:hypothetical protein